MSQSDLEQRDTAQSDAERETPQPTKRAQAAVARARRAGSAAVSVIHLDTGGCGACAQSVYALLAPRYAGALRAEGISVARSPRHADIALITGGMTRAARAAALRALDATPYPHALVAVGDCAIDGCVFRGSPLLVAEPAEALDANVEIAGCPPTPEAILAAIVEAKRLLTGEAEDEDTDEGEASDETPADVADADKASAAEAAMVADEEDEGASAADDDVDDDVDDETEDADEDADEDDADVTDEEDESDESDEDDADVADDVVETEDSEEHKGGRV